jgi:hypothetical protein
LYEQPIIEDDLNLFCSISWTIGLIVLSFMSQTYTTVMNFILLIFNFYRQNVSYERCSPEENPAQLDLNLYCFYSAQMVQTGRFLFCPDKGFYCMDMFIQFEPIRNPAIFQGP